MSLGYGKIKTLGGKGILFRCVVGISIPQNHNVSFFSFMLIYSGKNSHAGGFLHEMWKRVNGVPAMVYGLESLGYSQALKVESGATL